MNGMIYKTYTIKVSGINWDLYDEESDALMEAGIHLTTVIGVSAGAAFGCNYKSKQIGRVIRYNTRFSRDKRYGGFRVLPGASEGGQFLQQAVLL